MTAFIFFSNFSDEIKNNYSNFYLIDSINEACKVGLGPSHFKLAPGEKISKLPGVLSECFLSRDVGKRYDNNNSVAILNFLRNSRFVYVSDRRDFDSRKLKYSFFTGDTIKVSFSNNLKISYFIPYLKEFLDDSIR